MRSHGLWVPGKFPGTNEVLSMARAAGHYAGWRKAMLATGRWRDLRQAEDHYTEQARFVRGLVGELARAVRAPAADGPVRLKFRAHGYERWDPAALYLVAKWAEDGLVDAGVLPGDTSREVRETSIAVCRHEWRLNPGQGIYIGWEGAQ